jgi:hypothetical protein
MPRLPHGRVNITIDTLREARDTVADRAEDTNLGFAVVKSPDSKRFEDLRPEHALRNSAGEMSKRYER